MQTNINRSKSHIVSVRTSIRISIKGLSLVVEDVTEVVGEITIVVGWLAEVVGRLAEVVGEHLRVGPHRGAHL